MSSGPGGDEPSVVEGQVGAGFQAMAAGDWIGARDAFSAVLVVAEVPEALFGLANALFWLGDIAGTIANCERAYAASRRRGDLMFAAGAALSLVGYNKGYLGNTAAARGWLARAARIIESEVPQLRGELLGATAYVTDDPVQSEALARQAAEIGRADGKSRPSAMAVAVMIRSSTYLSGLRGAERRLVAPLKHSGHFSLSVDFPQELWLLAQICD